MIVAIDYETCDSRGASFEFFRKDFRVFSLSCCWRDPKTNEPKTWFSVDRFKIAQKLKQLETSGAKIVAHNLPFEMGVTNACYPHIKLNWYADTMRLTQLRDGGGPEFGTPTLTLEQEIAVELGEMSEKDVNKLWQKTRGNSLEASVSRFLGSEYHDHKKPAHDWLEKNHGITKDHGQYLDKLPHAMLEEYNNADTLTTLLLFEDHIKYFEEIGFDWTRDRVLYFNRARLMTRAYQRGIKINQEALFSYILELEAEIETIEQDFLKAIDKYLPRVRRIRLLNYLDKKVSSIKTTKGRKSHIKGIIEGKRDSEWKDFNPGSSAQLAILFVEVMGLDVQFTTPKGSPSMKTTHLNQWGDTGLMLQKRKKRLLVLTQAVNTYISSLYDGRTHPSVKISGTRTGRVAGGRD